MKVNIYETVEVSDEARKRIAEFLGQKTATREDLKAFIWEHGSGWEAALDEADDADEDEDLLGPGGTPAGKPLEEIVADIEGEGEGEIVGAIDLDAALDDPDEEDLI